MKNLFIYVEFYHTVNNVEYIQVMEFPLIKRKTTTTEYLFYLGYRDIEIIQSYKIAK